MKYLASVVSLVFQSKTLRIKPFPASNSLNFAELVEIELMKSIPKICTNINFSIQFIASYCKDFKSL